MDTAISETSRDWLAAATPITSTAPAATFEPVPADLPNNLAAFHALLADGAYGHDVAPPNRRVGPTGDPASGLMIVTDMPDAADMDARHLLAGDVQRLFEAMLAAMNRSRDTIYLASLSPARISGGRITAALAVLMRHHIALVKPKAVMLLGDETCRALLGMERGQARGGLRALNHDSGTVPAIAIVHPRFMLRHPASKADAWAEMRRLIGEHAS